MRSRMSRGWGTPCPFSSRLNLDVEINVSAATSSRVAIPTQASKLGAEAPPREQRSLWGRHLATLRGGRVGLRRRDCFNDRGRRVVRERPLKRHRQGERYSKPRRGIPSRFLPAGETRAIACGHAVAGRNLDMQRRGTQRTRAGTGVTKPQQCDVPTTSGCLRRESARMPRRAAPPGCATTASHRLAAHPGWRPTATKSPRSAGPSRWSARLSECTPDPAKSRRQHP